MSIVQFSSVPQMKVHVTNSGSHFFDRDAMRFFNSKIETGVLSQSYFITSERMEREDPKLYTIRYVTQDAPHLMASVEQVGEFQQFATLKDAKAALKAHLSA